MTSVTKQVHNFSPFWCGIDVGTKKVWIVVHYSKKRGTTFTLKDCLVSFATQQFQIYIHERVYEGCHVWSIVLYSQKRNVRVFTI